MKIKPTEHDRNPQNSEQMFDFIGAGLAKEGPEFLRMVAHVKEALNFSLANVWPQCSTGKQEEAIRFVGLMLAAAMVKVVEKCREHLEKQ